MELTFLHYFFYGALGLLVLAVIGMIYVCIKESKNESKHNPPKIDQ